MVIVYYRLKNRLKISEYILYFIQVVEYIVIILKSFCLRLQNPIIITQTWMFAKKLKGVQAENVRGYMAKKWKGVSGENIKGVTGGKWKGVKAEKWKLGSIATIFSIFSFCGHVPIFHFKKFWKIYNFTNSKISFYPAVSEMQYWEKLTPWGFS